MMATMKKLRQRCFFDVQIGDKNVGRIVFELFNDICPKTCDNFRSLCTGEKGLGKTTEKALHYKNTLFHRVVKNFIIQSGDFSMGNGRGGESIFGGTFDDENFDIKHDKPFLLSMANRGKNTNGSQFFITLAPAPHLDGVHVVFGHVLSGQEVIDEILNIERDGNCKPLVDVIISNCGELIPQIKPKEKKKKHRKEKSKKSDGEITSDDEVRDGHQKTKKKKEKKHKKHKNEKKSEINDENAKETEELSAECSVRPEDIPVVPENHFLMRSDSKDREIRINRDHYNDRNYSFSRRKFKGRGNIRYRTPSPDHYRSGSETPPHWKDEQSRLVSFKYICDKQREIKSNKDLDRNRYERRENYQRREFKRNVDLREKFRESSDNENTCERRTDTRKRTFTEERTKRSASPKHNSNHRKDRNGNNGESYVDSKQESVKYPEIERHLPVIRSAVKVNEDFSSKRNRRETSRERHNSEEYNEEHRHESPLDLTDIPLPNSDSNKRNRNEKTIEREDRHKRTDSRERDYSHKKVSSRH